MSACQKCFFYGEIMRHPGVVPTNNEGLIVAIVEHQMIEYFLHIFSTEILRVLVSYHPLTNSECLIIATVEDHTL